MVKYIQSLLLVLLLCPAFIYSQVTVRATTDTTKYKVGDYINYKLELTYDKNVRINYPSVKDSIKNLELIKEETPVSHESSSKVMESRSYIFSKYDSSVVNIPSYTIGYVQGDKQGRVTVNPLTIIVETIPVDTTQDIRDVKAPIEIPFNWLLLVIILAALLILGLTGFYIYQYYKGKKKPFEKPVVKVPPHVVALGHLHELEAKHLWQNGRIKEYHSEITEIIRKYFEDRFNFLALEMTTAEVLKCLEQTGGAARIITLTEEFLNNADLVKFAKFVPIPSLNDEMMKQAYNIVNQTVPIVVTEEKKEGENV